MTERYTRKDAEEAGRRLAEAAGHRYGHSEVVRELPEHVTNPTPGGGGEEAAPYATERKSGGWFVTIPGGWAVDYNPTYGGCVIEEIAPNGRTWISQPFGATRRSPRQFCEWAWGVIRGIDIGRSGVDR
jgi:hypothetical protein